MRAPRDPLLIAMSDSVSRIRNASRSVGRDTSNWRINSTSDGRLSPSASSPRTILLRRIVRDHLAGLGRPDAMADLPGIADHRSGPHVYSCPANYQGVPI